METRAGYSACFNVEKSVSMLWASLPREKQVVIEKAVMEAARKTQEFAEKNGYYQYRNGEAGKLIAMNYLHFTSRETENSEPDMHLHVHSEIVAAIQCADGKWRALDATELFARQAELAALFDGHLYEAIQRDLPEKANVFDAHYERSGLYVEGISDEERMENSKRRKVVNNGMTEMGVYGAAASNGVAKRTRPAKSKDLDTEKLRDDWRLKLQDLKPGQAKRLSPTMLEVEQLAFKNKSVFTERDLDRTIAQLAICHGGSTAIPGIRSAVVEQLGVMPAGQDKGVKLYTTEAYRGMEGDLAAYSIEAQKPVHRFALSPSTVHQAIKNVQARNGYALYAEQEAAVWHCVGGERISIVKGPAGTGKSLGFDVTRESYELGGHRVFGLAPSGSASASLQSSAKIEETSTIHSFLMKVEHKDPRYRLSLSDTDVIIVDEAGMIDLRTLHKLFTHTSKAGAKLILGGDAQQLEAVGSASSLETLIELVGAAELVNIARQPDPTINDISQTWFAGPTGTDPRDALEKMEDLGLIKRPDQPGQEAIDVMMSHVQATHEEGVSWKDMVLLADRNKQVRALNERVRDYRKNIGELDESQELTIRIAKRRQGPREIDLAPGDRVMLRRNAVIGKDQQQVFNGDRAEVVGLRLVEKEDGKDDVAISVRMDRTGDVISFLESEYNAIDHGYSMTVHKSQGLTLRNAFYLVGETTDRRLAYVAFTRSKEACLIFVDRDEDVYEALKKNTAQFASKVCALDADPATKEMIIRSAGEDGHVTEFRAQPEVKVLLEKAGVRFQHPAEPEQPAKDTPHMVVIADTPEARSLAKAKGYAVTNLIDIPADTPYRPGKPYVLPEGATKVALAAGLLPPVPEFKAEAHVEPARTHEEEKHDRAERPERPGSLSDQQYGRDAGKPADRSAPGAEYRVLPEHERYRPAGGYIVHKVGAELNDPFSAFRPGDPMRLHWVPGGGVVHAGSGERAAGLLPPDAPEHGKGEADSVRREGDRVRGPAGLKEHQPVGKRKGLSAAELREKRDAQRSQTNEMRKEADLIRYAESLGYQIEKGHGKKYTFMRNPEASTDMQLIGIREGTQGQYWVAAPHGQAGGDIFRLYESFTGQDFLKARDDVRAFLGRGSVAEKSDRQPAATPVSQDHVSASAAERTANAAFEYQAGNRGRGNSYLVSRGFTPETLAATSWKTGRYGNALFAHRGPDGRYIGHEKRGVNSKTGEKVHLFSESDRGIYIANPKASMATEIKVSEGGIDALALYQLATTEERQGALFTSTGGNPGPDSVAALIGLADRLGITDVSLVYDRDEAGDRHTLKMLEALREHAPHLNVRDARDEHQLQPGEDPHDRMKRETEQPVSPAPVPTPAAKPLPAQEITPASSEQEPTPAEPESAPEQQQAEENTQAIDAALPIEKDIEYD
jgi:conjugative relaxase-like TrwC/TraI family protein